METEIRLHLNETVWQNAEAIARGKNTTVQQLVEDYLLQLADEKPAAGHGPVVSRLIGILKQEEEEGDDYRKYLEDKYK